MTSTLGPLLLAWTAATTATAPVSVLPMTATPVAALATPTLRHDEALRIRRDFGQPDYEIALDVWGPGDAAPASITDVRLWWARTSKGDERSPFGPRLRRAIDVQLRPDGDDAWMLRLLGDHKRFDLRIEVDGAEAAVFADIVTDEGTRIEHCRATTATLQARRLFGIPIGIADFAVTCRDDAGREHAGRVPWRRTRFARAYDGE